MPEAPKEFVTLEVDAEDMELIRKTAHKISPSTRQMGFNSLSKLLKQLEKSIENKLTK